MCPRDLMGVWRLSPIVVVWWVYMLIKGLMMVLGMLLLLDVVGYSVRLG